VFTPPLDVPPSNGATFYWNTATAPVGTTLVTVTATNDWGQVSNQVSLTINIIPEPASIALVSLGIGMLISLGRRRR
jgi:hypothetical protein